MTGLQIVLTINQRSKSIPYPAETHSGSQNFGFRVLKGRLDKIEGIQEAKDSSCIKQLLCTLNAEASPFFSVGCEKSFNRSPSGFWAKGYIEFAFNYSKLVSDAAQYFPLFFHFSRYASDYVTKHDVQFWWELQQARFEAADCEGFSCCVWITTGQFGSSAESQVEWESAVEMLGAFIEAVKIRNPDSQPIYGRTDRQER